MKQLLEYRQKLIDRLDSAAQEFRSACLAVADPHAPLEPGGWNVHQVAAHTRDVDQLVYGARARRTLAEDNPEFTNFDGDTYMAAHYDPAEPLPQMLDGFVASVHSLVELLRDTPPEGWARESRHQSLGGGLAVQTWVERALDHIEEHRATVMRAARTA